MDFDLIFDFVRVRLRLKPNASDEKVELYQLQNQTKVSYSIHSENPYSAR